MMHYGPEELDIIARTKHVETEEDALAYALGLLVAHAGDRAVAVGFRRIALESYDVLLSRARDLGLDLSYYDSVLALVRRAVAVDGRNIDDVPSGDNGSA